MSADGSTVSCGDAGSIVDLSNEEKPPIVTARTCCRPHHRATALRAMPEPPGLMCRTAVHADERSEGCPWEEILQDETERQCRVFDTDVPLKALTDPFATLSSPTPRLTVEPSRSWLCPHLTPGDTTAARRIDCCCSASLWHQCRRNRCVVTGEGWTLSTTDGVSSMACAQMRAAVPGRGHAGLRPQRVTAQRYLAIDVDRTLALDTDVLSWHSISGVTGGYSIAGVTFARGDPDLAYVSNRTPDSLVVLDTSLATSKSVTPTVRSRSSPRRASCHGRGCVGAPAGEPSAHVRQQGEDLLAAASFGRRRRLSLVDPGDDCG